MSADPVYKFSESFPSVDVYEFSESFPSVDVYEFSEAFPSVDVYEFSEAFTPVDPAIRELSSQEKHEECWRRIIEYISPFDLPKLHFFNSFFFDIITKRFEFIKKTHLAAFSKQPNVLAVTPVKQSQRYVDVESILLFEPAQFVSKDPSKKSTALAVKSKLDTLLMINRYPDPDNYYVIPDVKL